MFIYITGLHYYTTHGILKRPFWLAIDKEIFEFCFSFFSDFYHKFFKGI